MNIVRLSFFSLLFSGFCFIGEAQTKQTEKAEQVWLGYLNQTRLSNKWGIWVDAHLRTKDNFVSDLTTGIFRSGLTYYLNDDLKFTAGYAFINHFPGIIIRIFRSRNTGHGSRCNGIQSIPGYA